MPPDEPQRVYTCPDCQNEIAPMFDHPDYPVKLLNLGGVIILELHGICKQCGGTIHFQSNTLLLQRLLRRQGLELSESELNCK